MIFFGQKKYFFTFRKKKYFLFFHQNCTGKKKSTFYFSIKNCTERKNKKYFFFSCTKNLEHWKKKSTFFFFLRTIFAQKKKKVLFFLQVLFFLEKYFTFGQSTFPIRDYCEMRRTRDNLQPSHQKNISTQIMKSNETPPPCPSPTLPTQQPFPISPL